MFDQGHIRMATDTIHTVKPLEVDIPRGRLVAVTGVSGSGKTTLVLETLIPALKARAAGEAQRLKLASEMGRVQDDAVFVFDEPTIGLHPLDVQVLLSVFDGLVAKGATVIVIEHDLDLIRNADYVIDMGPGGGDAGGQIVCAGTPGDIAACSKSITGRYL